MGFTTYTSKRHDKIKHTMWWARVLKNAVPTVYKKMIFIS